MREILRPGVDFFEVDSYHISMGKHRDLPLHTIATVTLRTQDRTHTCHRERARSTECAASLPPKRSRQAVSGIEAGAVLPITKSVWSRLPMGLPAKSGCSLAGRTRRGNVVDGRRLRQRRRGELEGPAGCRTAGTHAAWPTAASAGQPAAADAQEP